MRLRWLVVALVSLIACGAAHAAPELTYLGNDGVLISAAGRKVVIDALYGDGLPGYVTLPVPHRDKLELAQAPFDGIDLILATHYHRDHFDAGAVALHLARNPKAVFVSTEQAVAKLREQVDDFSTLEKRVHALAPEEGRPVRLEPGGIALTVLNLHHGRGRDVQNLGFIVELGGTTFLHTGDTLASAEDLAKYDLFEKTFDVALLPFFQLDAALSNSIRARRVVALHLPAADAPASYFGNAGNLDALIERIESVPGILVFRKPMERRTLGLAAKPAAPSGG